MRLKRFEHVGAAVSGLPFGEILHSTLNHITHIHTMFASTNRSHKIDPAHTHISLHTQTLMTLPVRQMIERIGMKTLGRKRM